MISDLFVVLCCYFAVVIAFIDVVYVVVVWYLVADCALRFSLFVCWVFVLCLWDICCSVGVWDSCFKIWCWFVITLDCYLGFLANLLCWLVWCFLWGWVLSLDAG